MNFLPFVILTEVGMTIFLSYIILYTYDRRNSISFKERAFISLVLVMMAGMLESITYYLITVRSFLSTIIAVNISMLTMSVALILLFWVFATKPRVERLEGYSILAFSGLLIMNEVSMGVFVYTLAFGFNLSESTVPLYSAIVDLISLGINSYLFILPMVTEMLIFFFMRPVHGTHRILLLALIATAVLSPTMAGNTDFTSYGSLIVVAVMTVFIPLTLRDMIMKVNSQDSGEGGNSMWIFPILLLMMGGVLFGALGEAPFGLGWALYGVGMVWGMAYYFAFSFSRKVKKVDLQGSQLISS